MIIFLRALGCVVGTGRWNVSLPVAVQGFAPAVGLATALPAPEGPGGVRRHRRQATAR